MSYTLLRLVVVGMVFIAACTTQTDVPATAPSTSSTSTSSSPTTPASSTTTAPVDRTDQEDRAEYLRTIVQQSETQRLASLYAGDREAFAELFAETPYLDEALRAFDFVEPGQPPTVELTILEVIRDDEVCVAVWIESDVEGEASPPYLQVLLGAEGSEGIAWVSDDKDSWWCEGSHPLSR